MGAVAVLEDLEVGDEAVVAYIAIRGSVVAFSDLAQVFLEVSDGVLEACHLGGMLGGPGLDGEGEAVDELRGRDVGMSIEGSQDSTGG